MTDTPDNLTDEQRERLGRELFAVMRAWPHAQPGMYPDATGGEPDGK